MAGPSRPAQNLVLPSDLLWVSDTQGIDQPANSDPSPQPGDPDIAFNPILSSTPDIDPEQVPDNTQVPPTPAPKPAREPVVLRRLSRAEYDATIRDLFGEDFGLSRLMPHEDPSLGFDNIADAQFLSPLQVENYEQAAWELVEHFVLPISKTPIKTLFEAEDMQAQDADACCGSYMELRPKGSLSQTIEITSAGLYEFEIRSYAKKSPAILDVFVDGDIVASHELTSTDPSDNFVITQRLNLAPGSHHVELVFSQDDGDSSESDATGLFVDWLFVQGPLNPSPDQNPRLAGLLGCDPQKVNAQACFESWVTGLAPKAWRRPLQRAELDSLTRIWQLNETQEEKLSLSVAQALTMILLSPHFLFRVELDPVPNRLSSRELNGYELAVRLSYFLWSSLPDAALFELAEHDRLLDDRVLTQQVKRMLDDPKAQAFVSNFAGQWLNFRDLQDLEKDPETFPEYNSVLEASFKRERELFFESFLEQDRPLQELLTSTTTFVNRPLAQFYGLNPVGLGPDTYEQRSLKGTQRRGLLGQAGLLASLAHPESTAPVERGKWILENILCIIPPPPPPDLGTNLDEHAHGKTMREQLAVHQENPTCTSCHQLMDPLGLALENFDGIGGWRNTDRGMALDVSGQLPNGAAFDGPVQMALGLAQTPEFMKCSTKKALIYALGRDLNHRDEQDLQDIVDTTRDQGGGIRSLILAIIKSPVFRRRG